MMLQVFWEDFLIDLELITSSLNLCPFLFRVLFSSNFDQKNKKEKPCVVEGWVTLIWRYHTKTIIVCFYPQSSQPSQEANVIITQKLECLFDSEDA